MQFVFDLDGTICFKGKPVTENILKCLEELKGNGHDVIFASARPIRDMLPVFHKRFHSFPLIGGNGSLISKNGKVIKAQAFSEQNVNNILSIIKQHQGTYLIDGKWNYAYNGPQDHPILNKVDPSRLAKCVPVTSLDSIVKVLILESDNMEEVSQELINLNVTIHKHKDENLLDISPNNINKWNALQTLGVKEGFYIAFGNDANDITMFQKAAHTVMIGSNPDLNPYAKESILVDEDCEGQIISKLKDLDNSYSFA